MTPRDVVVIRHEETRGLTSGTPCLDRRLSDLLDLQRGPGAGECVWWLGTLDSDAGRDVQDAAALYGFRRLWPVGKEHA